MNPEKCAQQFKSVSAIGSTGHESVVRNGRASSQSPARSNRELRILRDSFCLEDKPVWAPHGAGGPWRRRQIDGILRRHNVEPVDLERPPTKSLPLRGLRSLWLKQRFGRSIRWTPRSLGAAEYSYRFYRHNARRKGVAPVALLESGINPVAIAALQDEGCRVIATLSAIHSLSLTEPTRLGGGYPRMFQQEILALSTVDSVFCISREEQWLLNNLGIGAHYLPYYPDEERAKELHAERDLRERLQGRAHREFLICVQRNNSENTIAACREQAEWICDACAGTDAVFHVTGYSTEEIKNIWLDKRFVFHGTCSDEEFREVKKRCSAIALHQSQGTGAVTRIPDMILSGLAVIANGLAARTYIDIDGVYIYDTPNHLRDLFRADIPMPPAPQRPIELEDAFFASMQLR